MGTREPIYAPNWQDFRSLALSQVDEAAERCATKLEVPGSAVGHIIGKSHRTINALRLIPGVIHVSVHEDMEDEDKQRVEVEGSADGVSKVLAQIKRLHMRSYAASLQPEMQYTCFGLGLTRDSQSDDPLILRLAAADKVFLYIPQHLRAFVYRNFPEDFDDRMYYYFHSRSSGEAAATSFIVPPPLWGNETTRKTNNRRKFLEKSRTCQLFGSWERANYHDQISATLSKVLELCRTQGKQIKIRLILGKHFYFGTGLTAGVLWKLSLEQMDDKLLDQKLRPLFSVYCSCDNVRKARQYLCNSGYERVNVTRMVSAQLVNMDCETDNKESYHLKLSQRSEGGGDLSKEANPVVRFHNVANKHAFLTLLNEHKGVDLELRIQSRQTEDALDPETCKSIFEAWHKISNVEDPFISPAGKRYYPLNILHKAAEIYGKGLFEVAVTEVTTAHHHDASHDESSGRWKVSIRSLSLQELFEKRITTDVKIEDQVKDIWFHVELLLGEASKLAESMADS